MLRNKVICAFVAVWCAVCLVYAGIRTAYGAISGAIADTSETTANETVPKIEASPIVKKQTTTEDSEAKKDERISDEGDTAAEVNNITVEETPDEVAEEPSTEEPMAEPDVTSVPSLYEYLSQFYCGSCRRNCSLANPRCHNGSRLADAKAQEYYELYG